jgi:hypothetical protein
MEEWVIDVIRTSAVGLLTFYGGYFVTVRKERKAQVNQHKLEVLQKLYTPLYRTLIRSLHPMEGYDGLNQKSFDKIKEVIEENISLVDPELEVIYYGLKEDEFLSQQTLNFIDYDKMFFHHVAYHYNSLRKQLGLPFDRTYLSIRSLYKRWVKKNGKSSVLKWIKKVSKKVVAE